MKINITKKEYRLLLEMLYLADWTMNSQSVERRYKEHEELKKKIFPLYKEMGSEESDMLVRLTVKLVFD
ncbi:MAG TPA: hypothetical protein VJN02_03390 [Gammaproteobacteria bacterium]|nr:hypothetical protein [Gammaproteobacteria bacterium]